MSKTLSESAAEILQASMSGAGREPMNSYGVKANDLGGATPTDDYSTADQSGQGDEDESVGVAAQKSVAQSPSNASRVPPGSVEEFGESGDEELREESEEDDEEDDDEEEGKMNEEGTGMTGEVEGAEEALNFKKNQLGSKGKLGAMSLAERYRGSMRDDIDALFNGESLSEDFRVKATLIFESAVQSRIESIVEEILEENDKVLEEAIEEIKQELSDQTDEYLSYVAEEWVKENEVAIETGLRAELSEEFISGLRSLFLEHYIDIPEEKADVAEELANMVADLEDVVIAQEQEVASLSEQVNSVKKERAIVRVCEGLTAVQAAKMKSLAESVEFTADGDFDNKLAVLRENYFPSNKSTVKSEVRTLQETTEVPANPEVEEVTNSIMARYVQSITKTAPKA
jgi:hypothetical protein